MARVTRLGLSCLALTAVLVVQPSPKNQLIKRAIYFNVLIIIKLSVLCMYVYPVILRNTLNLPVLNGLMK